MEFPKVRRFKFRIVNFIKSDEHATQLLKETLGMLKKLLTYLGVKIILSPSFTKEEGIEIKNWIYTVNRNIDNYLDS